MLRKKIALILATFVLAFFLLTSTISHAVDDLLTSENNDVEFEVPEESFLIDKNPSLSNSEKQTINSDLFLINESILIDYVVEGNVYVIAKDVTVNSQINGDLFVLARVCNYWRTGIYQ